MRSEEKPEYKTRSSEQIIQNIHLKPIEYTFFSSAHGTFSRIDAMLGHKASLNKFKKTETISNIFSDHNSIRLEINYKKNGENTNMWRENNMLCNNQSVNREIKQGN